MERRKLLQSLLSLPALLGVSAIPAIPVEQEPLTYRGFKIKWRGWFEPINQHVKVGQWIAYNKVYEHWHVYSAYPGSTYKCFPEQIFYISIQKDQEIPGPWSTPEELSRYRQDAFDRLIRYINANYKELTHQ